MQSTAAALMLGLLLLVTGAARPLSPAAAAAAMSVTDIPLANGATDRILLLTPSAPPRAVLIMFPGGDGMLHIDPTGAIGVPGNFLVRTADLWRQQGFAVVLPDAPSNDPQGLQGRRLSPGYADTISRIVAFAQAQTQMPVWLVGTSAGTPAAALGAATLPHGAVAGLVLTSSSTISVPDSPNTVFQVDLKKITVPTLIVSNKNDECKSTPPGDGPRLKAAISHATAVEFETVSGGSIPTSEPCDSHSYHGFEGVETQAVQMIAEWIIRHS